MDEIKDENKERNKEAENLRKKIMEFRRERKRKWTGMYRDQEPEENTVFYHLKLFLALIILGIMKIFLPTHTPTTIFEKSK